MNRKAMYFITIIIFMTSCMMTACSDKYTTEIRMMDCYKSLSEHLEQQEYYFYEVNDGAKAKHFMIEVNENLTLDVVIGESDNLLFYIIHMLSKKTKKLTEDNIKILLEIINILSKRQFSYTDIVDFINNKKYDQTPGELELLIKIRTWGFRENYSSEYRVYKDDYCSFTMSGLCK